jgi:hypothetical protein
MLPQYVLKRCQALELQLTLEQQRYRDYVEEELHKMRQQLVAAVREHQQQQQIASATVRETIEHLRQELADALQYLAQDVAQMLRQAEEHSKRALDNLRDEMRQLLLEREQAAARHQIPAAPLTTPDAPFPSAPEERHA